LTPQRVNDIIYTMKAISAVSKNWMIGKDGKLPWHSPEDLKFYNTLTTGCPIIVGRKTFETLPPLPERKIYVLVRDTTKELGEYVKNKAYIIDNIDDAPKNAWLCGGGSVYKQFLSHCSSLFLTEFDFDIEADTMFPYSKEDLLKVYSEVDVVKHIKNGVIKHYYTKETLIENMMKTWDESEINIL